MVNNDQNNNTRHDQTGQSPTPPSGLRIGWLALGCFSVVCLILAGLTSRWEDILIPLVPLGLSIIYISRHRHYRAWGLTGVEYLEATSTSRATLWSYVLLFVVTVALTTINELDIEAGTLRAVLTGAGRILIPLVTVGAIGAAAGPGYKEYKVASLRASTRLNGPAARPGPGQPVPPEPTAEG